MPSLTLLFPLYHRSSTRALAFKCIQNTIPSHKFCGYSLVQATFIFHVDSFKNLTAALPASVLAPFSMVGETPRVILLKISQICRSSAYSPVLTSHPVQSKEQKQWYNLVLSHWTHLVLYPLLIPLQLYYLLTQSQLRDIVILFACKVLYSDATCLDLLQVCIQMSPSQWSSFPPFYEKLLCLS